MRLKTKKVFAQLWKTEKLLTYFDSICIGRPPGQEEFQVLGKHWLHTDQIASPVGLHADQGALYLEEQCLDNWTFHVLEGLHELHDTFYEDKPQAAEAIEPEGHYQLTEDEVEYYKRAGYTKIERVLVPKGGMALWDWSLFTQAQNR